MAPHHRDNDTSMETILNYDNRDAVRYILIVLDLHVGVAVQLYYYYKFFCMYREYSKANGLRYGQRVSSQVWTMRLARPGIVCAADAVYD